MLQPKKINRWLMLAMIFVLVFESNFLNGQTKKNLGFESGTFNGWEGAAWFDRITNPYKVTLPVPVIDPERHFIMTDKSGYDPNTGNQLKLIPPGYNFSAKLGTSTIPAGERVVGGQVQSLSYTMKIDSSNAFLLWKFAVVLQDPTSNHAYDEEPRFKISLKNEKGDTIPDCSYYDVYAGDASIKGFRYYTPPGNNPTTIVWRDWTTVGANLLPYVGKSVTIEFMSAGCRKSGHYGYGYFVLDCLPLYIKVDYCRNSKTALLIGPEGFEKYEWLDDRGIPAGTGQILTLTEPLEGAKYTCNLTSATGCHVTLTSTIVRYEPNADFTSQMVDCINNQVSFTNKSSVLNGSIHYLWKFGQGDSTTLKNPVYKFPTSGIHKVGLYVFNPPSGCVDTLIKDVESFSPPLVKPAGLFTYCPGKNTVIKGTGAFKYKWFDGSTKDSILIDKDTKAWMIGYSSNGCYSDTLKFNISQEPDWPFAVDFNPIICRGDTVSLDAKGAVSYLWNTGETTSSIPVSNDGSYSVAGTNPRGCIKNETVKLTMDELPLAEFDLDKHVVDKRHNTITSKISQEKDVNYFWDMGDGKSGNGNTYTHFYDVKPEDLKYEVKLTAVNENKCKDTSVQTVLTDVFIPNVFTPNNDLINDVFMPGYFLQVFERNGIMVYTGKDGWDGKYKGKTMSPDTYFYVLEYENIQKEIHKKQGFITLVR